MIIICKSNAKFLLNKSLQNVEKAKQLFLILFGQVKDLLCQPKIVTRANGILWMFYNINNHG